MFGIARLFRSSALALSLGTFGSLLPAYDAQAFDPLKIRRLSSSIDRASAELRELERQADRDASARIEQLIGSMASIVTQADNAVRDRITDLDGLVERAERLEREIYRSAIDLLYRAQCKVEITSDTLRRTWVALLNDLRKSHPRVTIGGLIIAQGSVLEVTVQDPDLAYRDLKRLRMADLRQVRGSDEAYQFVSTFQNLARMARLTRCHYLDLELAEQFTQEVNEMERLTHPWAAVGAARL